MDRVLHPNDICVVNFIWERPNVKLGDVFALRNSGKNECPPYFVGEVF